MEPLTVTFDTCAFRILVEDHKREAHPQKAAFDTIKMAIQTGRIIPFVSDVLVILEGIPKHERAKAFQSIGLQSTRDDKGITGYSPEGVPIRTINITLTPTMSRPELPEQLLQALNIGKAWGFQYISIPRIGMPFVDNKKHYKPESEAELSVRLQRLAAITQVLSQRGVGSGWVYELSKKMIADQPALVQRGDMRAFAEADPKKVARVVAEWADGDAIAAHYSYGHDIFCTLDEGKSAGSKAALHSNNRAWLVQEFGIQILCPQDLADTIQD